MFCYQCQEAAKGTGCTVKGICGKTEEVAKLQDVLLFVTKGLAHVNNFVKENNKAFNFIIDALFTTITNANFDSDSIVNKILRGIALRDEIKANNLSIPYEHSVNFTGKTKEEFLNFAPAIGVLAIENEDIRSLKELLTYGVKGMAAYAEHAINLGYENMEICLFIQKALIATTNKEISADELVNLVLECGKYGVDVMALLDKANTENFGNPEITKVNIGVRSNPAILISGHDLKDMKELLEQTEGTGIDVYTHSEMLPANYYPAFKKYEHFVGNYGNSWWKQKEEFESFNGPILFTTNCIVPPKDAYKDRIYTTGASGFEGCIHIADRKDGKQKDFGVIIEHAKRCAPPVEIEKGEIIGGFAHNQVLQLADKVVEAVKTGAIKKFVVMAGCDGRMNDRSYYSDFAKELPKDTVILTAGCAKYRYNKLELGDIGGIPRVLDAGQCNDSYSLAVTALKLKEVFGLQDINELPIVYNIAWYEQKAVIVLLALLSLGIKNIHLGPTLPAFLSPNVAKILIENFNIGGITDVKNDMEQMIYNY